MKMAVPRKAAPPSAPTKAQSMSENCRARNSDKKEGGQFRRRRSDICGETGQEKQEKESWKGRPNSRTETGAGEGRVSGRQGEAQAHVETHEDKSFRPAEGPRRQDV